MAAGSPVSDAREKSTAGSSSGFFSSPDAQNQVEGNTLLSNRIRELEKEIAEQKENQKATVSERMAFFKKYHDQLRLTALNGDTKLSDEMAEILGLSKEERDAVEHHLKDTSDAINKFIDSNQFVAKQDANGFTIETPANPQGKAIKDEMASSLGEEIGDDRAAFIMSYMDDSSSAPLDGFAQAKKDLEITWKDQNGKLVYTIKNQFYDPRGQGNSASWYDTPTLPPEDQKYVQADSTP